MRRGSRGFRRCPCPPPLRRRSRSRWHRGAGYWGLLGRCRSAPPARRSPRRHPCRSPGSRRWRPLRWPLAIASREETGPEYRDLRALTPLSLHVATDRRPPYGDACPRARRKRRLREKRAKLKEDDRGRAQRTLPSGWEAVGRPNGHCPLSDNGQWAGGGKVYTYPPKARIAESQHVTLLYALVTLALLNRTTNHNYTSHREEGRSAPSSASR